MAAKPTNQLRQVYEVQQGIIDIKLVTTRGLSGDEFSDFRKVIDAIEKYALAHPPEPLADVATLKSRQR
jgi:hypothetical protein